MSSPFNPASLSACSIGFIVLLNKSTFNSSNFALVNTSDKSLPPSNPSISIFTLCCADKPLFAFSTAFFSLPIALWFFATAPSSTPYFFS